MFIHCTDSSCGMPEDCGSDSNSSMPGDDDYFEDELFCPFGWHCIDSICRCGHGNFGEEHGEPGHEAPPGEHWVIVWIVAL